MMCPHCQKELPDYMYYDEESEICRIVVMR
jgi:hypothetical protein